MNDNRLPIAFLCLLTFTVQAQSNRQISHPVQWHHLDPATDKAIGISTDRAYELLKLAPAHRMPAPATPCPPVIVAVIDGGVDVNHDDLKTVVWTNAKEIAGNGKDDDRNGYADDRHGWNFLGLKDGRTLEFLPKEETRLYARLKLLYEGKPGSIRPSLSPAQQAEFDLYQTVKPYYTQKRAEAEKAYQQDSVLLAEDRAHIDRLKKSVRSKSARHDPAPQPAYHRYNAA